LTWDLAGAQEALREALRFPSRTASVRHRGRLERARVYFPQGQPAKARQDLERILAEDSQYPGVRDLLATI
jgi:Tfp pilus assembly protein PilF